MFLCTPPLDSVRDLNFRLAIQTTDKRTDVWSRDFMIYKPCPFDYGLKKFALDPVVVFFSKDVKKSTSVGSSIGWSSCCNFFLKCTWSNICDFFENDWIKSFYKSKWTGLKNQFWSVGCGLGWTVGKKGLGRLWATFEARFFQFLRVKIFFF